MRNVTFTGMNLAHRYEQLSRNAAGRFQECFAGLPPRDLTELEIQAHWFAGDFGTEFITPEGGKISVVQFGAWNREPGPDFVGTAVSINGGPPVRGSIEIDLDVRDWERHGHATNPEYDAVVLHVCVRQDGRQFFTRTSQHRNVPRIRLDLESLNSPPPNPLPIAKLGRCAAPLRDFSPEKLRGILEAAAQFRLQKKSARLARIGELHGADESLFQALAVALGYKNNKLPFLLIAQRLPVKFLLQNKSDLEAILFGIGGFLGGADLAQFDLETRAYLRELWDRWWKLRDRFSRLVLGGGSWRLSATRPVNHPQRRLAALAQIVRHWQKIRALARNGNMAVIRDFLENLRDEYWDFHFTLTSKKTPGRMALLGGTRVNDMLTNVFYPLAIFSNTQRWAEYAKLPAPLASRRARIAAIRLLSDGGAAKSILKNAACQQGLLQIYEDFCMADSSDCANCLFPKQVAGWR